MCRGTKNEIIEKEYYAIPKTSDVAVLTQVDPGTEHTLVRVRTNLRQHLIERLKIIYRPEFPINGELMNKKEE